ncbi:hypothetical protein ACIRPU_02985 [Streptomyces sp. NPDC102259]|uniref:hypothetical protein n=1 Tax=Streptomyces sp. NPDC102259 TaxID=3366148 RepID=UPI00381C1E8F
MVSSGTARPVVALVGSAASGPVYVPELKRPEAVPEACRELGRSLARAGYDLAVFSAKPKYIEYHVVQGYAEPCDLGGPRHVFVHVPRQQEQDFGLPADSSVTLRTVRDTGTEWEVSFFRTLLASDGALLIGGRQSTRVAGVIAMAQRIPLLPVAAFGGGAGQVWVNLDKVRNDVTDADITLLGQDWRPDSADRLVDCLDRQRQRRAQWLRQSERSTRRASLTTGLGMVVALLLLALSLTGFALAGERGPATGRSLAVLVVAPLLASMAGAVIRGSFETADRWPRAAVRGLGAGLVSVLLYVASQLLAVPTLLEEVDVRRLLFFTLPLGFSAGFTFDLVFERLRSGAAPEPPPLPGGGATAERPPRQP